MVNSLETTQTGCYWEFLDSPEINWKIPTSTTTTKKAVNIWKKLFLLKEEFFSPFKPSYEHGKPSEKKLPVEVQQLVSLAVPLKGQLCTLSSSEFWYFRVYYIYIYAFSRRFYPKRLTLHSSYSFTFYQLLLSLGIEPMILALLAPCSTIWATGKYI